MSFFTVGNAKDEVQGLLQGINLRNITNINGAMQRSGRTLLQKVDIPEANDVEPITIFDGVFDYNAPENIFGGAVIDFRPDGISRTQLDYVYRKPIELFDRTKALIPNGTDLTFEYNKGTPIVRIASAKVTSRTILDNMNDDDGWVVGGSLSNLVVDETVFYQSPASLRFDLTGDSVGTLQKDINQLSIAKYEDNCTGFLAIRTPNVSDLTNIILDIGSSSANFDRVTETEGFLGAWVVDKWLIVAFDFSESVSTGTPDWSAIDYINISFTHSAGISNFRVGGLWLSLPSPHELMYETTALFLNSGVLSKAITSDDDEIILNDAAYNLYIHEAAVTIAEQSSGGKTSKVAERYKDKLENELYPAYEADNPSGEIRLIDSYHEEFGHGNSS